MSNKSYHERYSEGYVPMEYTNKRGEKKYRQVYIGDYYRLDTSAKGWIGFKLLCTGLYALTWVLLGIACSRNLPCNTVWYVCIPMVASICFHLWLLPTVIDLLIASRDLTIGEYTHLTTTLSRFPIITAGCAAATALLTVLHVILTRGQIAAELLCALGYLASGAAAAIPFFLNRRCHYQCIPRSKD